MHRVRVAPETLHGTCVTLPPSVVHYVTRVLRLRVGDDIGVFDGRGQEYRVRLTTVSATLVQGKKLATLPEAHPCSRPLVLGQGLPKGAKLDLVVEKCSELGLTTLVPLYTARTIVRDVPERLANRVARWQRVAEAAARQCGRRTLLEVCSPVSVQDFCVHYQAAAVKIVCWEAERHQGLRQLLAADLPPGPVVALVGPEGGLSAEEVALASTYGFRAVSLGPQLLRTETAAIALTTMVRYSLGAFEPREEWYEEDTAGTP